jgi:hypothetical protein
MFRTRNQETQLSLSDGQALHGALAQELRRRPFQSSGTTLESDEPAGARRFRDPFDLIKLLA